MMLGENKPIILPVLLLLLASSSAGYLLPNPFGKYNVTLTTGPLTDYSRNDPYAATPTPRALMLSVFQPTTCASTEPVLYMPEQIATYQSAFLDQTFNITANLTSLFLDARLPVCPDLRPTHNCSSPPDDTPILLFSPGYSIPRYYYHVLLSSIASQGFTIFALDHPHDADIVVYPDGRAVYNNASIVDSPTWDEYPRAADASFVIDQLGNATAMGQLLPQSGGRARVFKTDRVAMFGHSNGGAAAVVAASRDRRIRGAINWDGSIFGMPPVGEGVEWPVRVMEQPVLFMGHQTDFDSDWLATWQQLTGPKMGVYVANTTHYTFSDVPTLFQAAGQDPTPLVDILGTIAPDEMVRILTAYTTAWMNGVFADKEGGKLLEGFEPGTFTEVSTLIRENF